MSSSQPIERRQPDAYSFRSPARTAFIMGLLAVAAGCSPFAFLIPTVLIITPAIVNRSFERSVFCIPEGLLILILVAAPLSLVATMDTRSGTPAVWRCVPSIQYFNPAWGFFGMPYKWCAMISFTGFTGFCFYRLAARLSVKRFKITAKACLAGTTVSSVLFPLSWSAILPAQWYPAGGTYTEYFLSHLMLGLSWAMGGMLTAYVATKLLHQKSKDQRNNAPPS